ncbi:MAG: hypothetical protein IKU10_08290 [Clostridia bacterium]|nr:hypothetical protein [Clostridia bacterium]
MKRFIAIVCVLCLVAALAGCQKEAPATPSDVTYFDGVSTVELNAATITKQVSEGKLDLEYESAPNVTNTHTHGEIIAITTTLGMESTELTELLLPSGYDPELHCKTGENYIRYEFGNSTTAYFYYTNDNSQNGLASVVYFGTAYGFEPTVTTIDQVKTVMGTPAKEGPANEKAMSMFLFFEPGYTYIDYVCGENHVSFFFHENGTLGATVVYQDGLWIY